MLSVNEPPSVDILNDLRKSNTRTLVVWGQHDIVNKPGDFDELIRPRLEQSTAHSVSHAVIAGSGHYLQHEKPAEFAAVVLDFLGGVGGVGGVVGDDR